MGMVLYLILKLFVHPYIVLDAFVQVVAPYSAQLVTVFGVGFTTGSAGDGTFVWHWVIVCLVMFDDVEHA